MSMAARGMLRRISGLHRHPWPSGFDRLFDLLEAGLCGDGLDGHPPFDVARWRGQL